MIIKEITFDYLWENGQKVIRSYYDELCLRPDLTELSPDLVRYKELERMGLLQTLGAFEGEEMIGQSVIIYSTPMHYSTTPVALSDSLFILKEHRNGSAGVRLIRRTEEEARKRGSKLLILHGKEGTTFVELVKKMKYWVQDILLAREL